MNIFRHRILLFFICLLMGIMPMAAQESDNVERRLADIVDIYFEGSNDYEFYRAIENYRNYTKANNHKMKYYRSWHKEIMYDINHNHYYEALEKTEQLRNILQSNEDEKYYYMIDYLMGVFYGTRDNNELSQEYLRKAFEKIKDDDLAKEMGGAFASMFGEESASPANVAEAPAEEPLSQEATSAKIEEESVKETVDESFDSLFGSSDDLPEEASNVAATAAAAPAPVETAKVDEPAPASAFSAPAETQEEAPSAELDSIDSEVSNAFKGLFDEDDALTEADEPNNKGVDYLMSGDSDDEVAASLVNNADAPLSRGAADLDDSLNTRTLADIYMEQGVYNKALDIYSDLAKKNPNNAEIKTRLAEIEKLCREKFGDSQNG